MQNLIFHERCFIYGQLRTTSYTNRRNAPKSNGPYSQKVLEIRSVTLFLCAFVPYALMPLFLYNCSERFTNSPFYAKRTQFPKKSNERK